MHLVIELFVLEPNNRDSPAEPNLRSNPQPWLNAVALVT